MASVIADIEKKELNFAKANFFARTIRKFEIKKKNDTHKRKENQMEKLRLSYGNKQMKVEGSPELIERERNAFYSYSADIEERTARAREEEMAKLRYQTSKRFALHLQAADRYESGVLRGSDWGDISQDIKSGKEFHIGDMVKDTLRDGTDFTMVVTDVTDSYVRFDSRDCVGKEVYWNRERTNKGGYPASAVCGYLENELWELLPEDLQNAIQETTRMFKEAEGDKEYPYKAKLFLPTASEVFGEDDCYGDEGVYKQLEYYKDRRNRMKGSAEGEDTCNWWLASVRSGNSTYACTVSYNGNAIHYNTTNDLHVPLCFQISKS